MPKIRKAINLERLPLSVIQQELASRERAIAILLRRRARILSELQAVNTAIQNGRPVSRPRTYGGHPEGRSLVSVLESAMGSKPMTAQEAAEAVQSAGYVTHSKHFARVIWNALLKSDRFKRIGRGKYVVKGR